jgi:pimeloyl-ACP methyl ester carboxylesterase
MVEYLKVIEPLTNPVVYGGRPEDAFHVVCPTLPGYGFSDKPSETGWGIERIGSAWSELMARLGYSRYGAHGSDWGASITTSLGQQVPDRLTGIHLSPPIAAPDRDTFDNLTEQERESLTALMHAQEWETGYSSEQSTKPQTLGYALSDSPVGLCAWIVEKFRTWMDCDGNPENILSKHELLDNVMLYWLPATGASAARLYWESFRQVSEWFTTSTSDRVSIPVGCSLYLKEIPRPSRRWAAKRYTNIVYWGEKSRGGHFAALEQPELFVEELRSFFRMVR